MSDIREIKTPGTGEYTEKKSRFIGVLSPVYTEEEAAFVTEQTRKQHYDARHVCSAYVILPDGRDPISRFSDDGEPSGTAGKPILDTINGAGIVNGIITVTRYFGGTLLGTGGLVRAYTAASKAAIESAVLAQRINVFPAKIGVGYAISEKVKYVLSKEDIPVKDTEYSEIVTFRAMVPTEKRQSLTETLTGISSGEAVIEWKDETGYLL